MSGEPFPKSRQLARGQKRYRRKVASPKQWQAILAAKCRGQQCRVCKGGDGVSSKVSGPIWIDPHHLVPRDHFGDDVADNIVGLCRDCHRGVELREPAHCRLMLTSLSDAEYAYAVEKAGEQVWERVYGITYERAT
jgi:HNH endonuclease